MNDCCDHVDGVNLEEGEEIDLVTNVLDVKKLADRFEDDETTETMEDKSKKEEREPACC